MKKTVLLFFGLLIFCVALNAQPRVIAHRGYWTLAGSAQNSIASLLAADKGGFYGSEFDVYIAKDGTTVIHHDPAVDGTDIESSDFKDLQGKRLQNGEAIPTLADYLENAKEKATIRLILEIKSHKSEANENRCVDEVLRQVGDAGLADRVEYISFSKNVCKRIAEKQKGALVAYLGGDWTPQEAKAAGMTGIDYYGPVFAVHPEWIGECHKLGLTVNVWTIDDLDDADRFIKAGVDFITTNKPVEVKKLCKED